MADNAGMTGASMLARYALGESEAVSQLESLVGMQSGSSGKLLESLAERQRESFLGLQESLVERQRESFLGLQESLVERHRSLLEQTVADWEDLRRTLEERSPEGDSLDYQDEIADSIDDADNESPSLDLLRTRLLLFMFVCWVRVTPHLSAQEMAEFVRWWVEVVAALVAGS